MNPEYDIYEQIDQYLSNNLSQEELTLFKSKMANDESLQELVEAQKLANEIIIDNEMIRLKERMQADLGKGGNSGGVNNVKILVTTVLIISASVSSYLYISSDKSSDKLPKSNSLNESFNNTKNVETDNLLNESSDNVKKKNKSIKSTKLSDDSSIPDNQNTSISTIENEVNHEPKVLVSPPQSNSLESKGTVTLENKNIDCNDLKISANTKVDFGFNPSEATIYIDKKSIKGGVGPYLFSLDKEIFSPSSKFENVKEGIYSIYIKDHNNCICALDQPVEVKPKFAAKEIDDAFNPSNGDKWTFPLGDNSDGSIAIYNKGGSIIYSTKINGGYPSEWDGRDVNGNELGTGNYYFIINFTDNKMVKGHITIVR